MLLDLPTFFEGARQRLWSYCVYFTVLNILFWPVYAQAVQEKGQSIVPRPFSVDFHKTLAPPGFLEYRPEELSTPAVDPVSGTVFVADRFGTVRSLDVFGNLRWEVSTGGKIEAGLLFRYDRLYVPTVRGKVICLNADNGDILWNYQGKQELATRATLAGNIVLVPGLADSLLALDAETGDFLWLYRKTGTEDLGIRGAPSPLHHDDVIYMGFSNGRVSALRLEDGEELWNFQSVEGEYRDIIAPPVLIGTELFIASFGGILHVLDPKTGREIRSSEIQNGAVRMASHKSRLIIASTGITAAYNSRDGAMLWETSLPGGIPSLLFLTDSLVFLGTGEGDEDGAVYALSLWSGRPAFAFPAGRGVSAGMAAADGGVWAWTNGGRLYRLLTQPRIRRFH